MGSHTALPDLKCQGLCEITKKSDLKRGNHSSLWSFRDDSSLSHFILLKFVSDIMGAKFSCKEDIGCLFLAKEVKNEETIWHLLKISR